MSTERKNGGELLLCVHCMLEREQLLPSRKCGQSGV
jgi:hypothetical protein